MHKSTGSNIDLDMMRFSNLWCKVAQPYFQCLLGNEENQAAAHGT